ncbi:hypothetical protein [Hugenholtzia roseola]|uniref:hypothetical protein n=1 Tax=Hugenholtzia roseola TaxID=1002 RepID=UPI0003F7C2AE|nr:hypothetical protein [Hugenholtzia roseola]
MLQIVSTFVKNHALAFKSAWVHTAVQLAIALFILPSNEWIYALIFLTTFPFILYFSFQFPILPLLIIVSEKITNKIWTKEQLFLKNFGSKFILALLGVLTAWLLLAPLAALLSQTPLETLKEVSILVFKYGFISLLLGEFVRQRAFYIDIYG